MNKSTRTQYLFQKKALLVLLYVFYRANTPKDKVILRSFGFHFDPACNFKAIIKSEGESTRKYTVHIFRHATGKIGNDIEGEINIYGEEASLPDTPPTRSLAIFLRGSNFKAIGVFENRAVSIQGPSSSASTLLSRLIESAETNADGETFLQWLMRLFLSKLPADLVMGAGINKDYGAKDWRELVNALNSSFYEGDKISEEEIRHYVGQELFTSSSMYRDPAFNTYKELAHELYEFEEARSFNDPDSTLYKCVDFLESHPGTDVITYNYDTNLEYLCKKRKLLYCTIYDDNSFSVKEAVTNIYHVHGLLPYGKYNEQRFTNSLVFNESDYYYLYNNPYSWNIAKQLHDFKFNVCFFIGISLTDPDMKRLLELGKNYLKFNFIFMRKEKGYGAKVFESIASYFFSFDLIVVWVEEYSEIGQWLRKL